MSGRERAGIAGRLRYPRFSLATGEQYSRDEHLMSCTARKTVCEVKESIRWLLCETWTQ